jgi:hypothetical protein
MRCQRRIKFREIIELDIPAWVCSGFLPIDYGEVMGALVRRKFPMTRRFYSRLLLIIIIRSDHLEVLRQNAYF